MGLSGFFRSMTEALAPWLGSVIVVVATGIVLVFTRLLLRRAGADRRGVPYQRQIATTLIVIAGVFALVVFLPIDPDVRGQILSLLGVLISAVVAFSSTSLVGNAMAGIMMRLSRSYRPGDFIQVENTLGRVIDQGLFHTEVQVITRDVVALPNLYVSRHPVHVTRASGTFVSVDVSLGYETAPDDAESALDEAVGEAGLEEPYVLVQELLDHAVRYTVFGLLKDTKELLSARSRLRRSIVTTLHRRGIQIVSPGYVNRVEYASGHVFMPEHAVSGEQPGEAERSDEVPREQEQGRDEQSAPEQSSQGQSVEAVAFDKAEEAESIEELRALREKLERRRGELDDEIKEAGDRHRKQQLADERDEIERRSERVAEIIQTREKEREERELEE